MLVLKDENSGQFTSAADVLRVVIQRISFLARNVRDSRLLPANRSLARCLSWGTGEREGTKEREKKVKKARRRSQAFPKLRSAPNRTTGGVPWNQKKKEEKKKSWKPSVPIRPVRNQLTRNETKKALPQPFDRGSSFPPALQPHRHCIINNATSVTVRRCKEKVWRREDRENPPSEARS